MKKSEIVDFLEKNEIHIQRAKANVFICDFYFTHYSGKTAVGEALSPMFLYVSSRHAAQIQGNENVRNITKAFYEKEKMHRSFFNKIIREHLTLAEKIDGLWPKFGDLEKLSNEALAKKYDKFLKLSRKHTEYDALGEDKGLFFEEDLIPKFKKSHGWSQLETQNYILKVTHPKKQSVLNQEKKLFLRACLEAKGLELEKNKELEEALEEYLEKFFWSKTDFYSAEKIEKKDLLKRIGVYCEKRSQKNIRQEIEELDKDHEEILSEKEKLLETEELSDDEKFDIEFITKYNHWVDSRKEMMMKKIFYSTMFLYEIGRRNNIPKETVINLTLLEVEKLVFEGVQPKKYLEKRQKENSFRCYYHGKPAGYFRGADASFLWNLARDDQKKGNIKGMVASSGGKSSVVGKVKVIKDAKNEEFGEGEILVTSMTRVEFVPIMKKALAVITNEGGIACHAAIVSRELKIPCIIGTKVATDVLKDGCKVKMNLKTGEIKNID